MDERVGAEQPFASEALGAAVRRALLADQRTANDPLEVTSLDGVVTLQGSVHDPILRPVVEEIARSIPGVVAVINEVEANVPHGTSSVVTQHRQPPA